MHPKTGDQVNRCVLSQKEPEEPARQGHGEVAELCEAAGTLLPVPELRDPPCYPCAEIQAHCDYFLKDMSGYILCGGFEYFGSYRANLGVIRARIGVTEWLAEWEGAEEGVKN
jgi:hypothetical protein